MITKEELDEMDLSEALDVYMGQRNNASVEGRRGIITICKIARVLDYTDMNYYGQLSPNASIGDLINMLEDNSGMITAMIEWIQTQQNSDWKDSIKSKIETSDEDSDSTE